MPSRENGYCFYSYNLPDFEVSLDKGVECHLGAENAKANTLLFGDSFAGQYEPFFDELFKQHNASVHSIVTNWCTPSITERFNGPKNNLSYEQCLLNRKYLTDNMNKYRNIIFAGSWELAIKSNQFDDVLNLVDKVAQEGINVFIMAAPFRYQKNPLKYFYRSIYFDYKFDINNISGQDSLMARGNERLMELSKKYKNVYFIERSLLFSKDEVFRDNGIIVPYSLDGEHISILGAKNSFKHFMNQIKSKDIVENFNFPD